MENCIRNDGYVAVALLIGMGALGTAIGFGLY